MSARDDQHIHAAAERAPVACRMTDGRTITGRLVYWPHAGRRSDRRARVQLPSGALPVRPTRPDPHPGASTMTCAPCNQSKGAKV